MLLCRIRVLHLAAELAITYRLEFSQTVFPFQRRTFPSLQIPTLYTGDVLAETFIDAPNVKSLEIVCDTWSDLTGLTADTLRSLIMLFIQPGTHRTLTPANFSVFMSCIPLRYLNWKGYGNR
ncbi:hypothetical protein M422DRAFT_39580 [Sphaerobolus stellatus SS14]|uniref:Uncharacterized protein n=1 Tax=Sphaerobolus stellatus (strain SS14) TaxID=990650 RepID=A0A0C9T3Q0_SPHS4|nr:hypothetical protein M422DRAFT_39580 [Sphaerobolus stellatus SS14]